MAKRKRLKSSDYYKRRKRQRYKLAADAPTPTHFVRIQLPKVEIGPDRRWYVVRTLANTDKRVAKEVEDRGAQSYVPMLVEERVRRHRIIEATSYPAAGYVFVGTDVPPEHVPALARCDGAVEVLTTANDAPEQVNVIDLQRFADNLTGCNAERREAYAMARRPTRARGFDNLRRALYG
jgi:hypothetical protein